MKKWFVIWILSIPVCLLTFMNSFFMTAKIGSFSQEECKPKFIFTPKDVQHCSDVYPIDIFLISLKTEPLSYICVISGLYLIGFIIYYLLRVVKHKNNYS
ncbi:hypothetical protein BACCIP111895_04142 [Neobacillus rhizosphaerae]|uniref:DUF4306 domain-containing protein n=1 Tax=Neobacillus rhizosphaerae TaxID=2880965 RepID=A0ABM9EW80_9BACI|nr:DUF4306 domain-containing protein [Neobacillus rhizosphaerae]CAH2716954.1 hypothetical protein BACCIP111895_04142 [Neobacillus rhizosphaerae]